MNLGDINGDGISDIAIVSDDGTNSSTVNIYFGGSGRSNGTEALGATDNVVIDLTADSYDIIGGGGIGDFNGDGFNDFALVTQNTSDMNEIEIFVMYGGTTIPATVDFSYLNDPNNAFLIQYQIPAGVDNTDFNVTIANAGDLNGDGFYDLAIGLPHVDNSTTNTDGSGGTDDDEDGSVAVIYGRETEIGSLIYDEDDGLADNIVTASTATDSLIGSADDDVLRDNNLGDINFRAGAGNDTMEIENTTLGNIDGGGGFDTLDFLTNNGSLDLSTFNAEDISRIEQINLGDLDGGQTLILSEDNVFNLLKNSDTGTLTISLTDTTNATTLQIDSTTGLGSYAGDSSGFADAIDAEEHTNADGFDIFRFGGYELKIDSNLFSTGVVDII